LSAAAFAAAAFAAAAFAAANAAAAFSAIVGILCVFQIEGELIAYMSC
jgi:hypothetical protein